MAKKRKVPVYQDTYPSHLIRVTDLGKLGLQPAPDQLPVALLKYKTRDGSGTCSLFERQQLVDRQAAS